MHDGGDPLLHYSEDPTITRFVPHVPATNPTHRPAVWAIDATHAALYWFPRDCPRVAVWARDAGEHVRLARAFGTEARRVQAIERGWLERMRDCRLFEYRLDREAFAPWPDAIGQWVANEVVEPLAVHAVGDLERRHREGGVELRVVDDLWPLHDAVLASGLPFGMVRMGNARPRSSVTRTSG